MSTENEQHTFVIQTNRPVADGRRAVLEEAFEEVCSRAGFELVACSVEGDGDRIHVTAANVARPHVAKHTLQAKGSDAYNGKHRDRRLGFGRVYYTGTRSGESSLDELDYRDLQSRAKDAGINASQGEEELREQLQEADA